MWVVLREANPPSQSERLVSLRFRERKPIVLDHRIRQQLFAHADDSLAGRFAVGGLQANLDELSGTNVGDMLEAERLEAALNGQTLGVVDNGLQNDVDLSEPQHAGMPLDIFRLSGAPPRRVATVAAAPYSSRLIPGNRADTACQ